MAGTYLGNEDFVISDDKGDAVLTNNGEGTGTGAYGVEKEAPVDTDADSWDSGSNEPDVVDSTKYAGAEPPLDTEDEGDEDDLGDEEDGEPDPDEIKIEGDLEPLDDEEIDDRGFDCD